MNRAEQGDLFQADLRKFRKPTFERKQMSTTIKRVALVAVAALGLGVVSVAPSQATVSANSLTLSSATSTQLTSETSTATAGVATLSFLNSDLGDTVSVTAYLMSAPAGNTVSPVIQVSETSSAVVKDDATGSALAAGAQETDQVVYVSSSTATPSAVTAKFKVYMNSATVAGTYVVKLVPAVTAGGGVIDTTGVTLTITVSANPSTDTVAKSATIILNSGETDTATSDATVTSTKTASLSAAAASIKVSLLNAAGVATTGESYTATVSGPGLLASGTIAGNPTATGRAITVKAGDLVQIFPDGTSGVSTVTINSAAGVILGTKSITFYGSAASITASTTALTTGTVAKVGSNTGLISFSVKDAAGVAVTTGTYYLVSADTTLISNSYTACSAYDATNGFRCDVAGVAKGTTTVYVTNRSSSTDTTTEVKSAAVSVRVGTTTPASVSVTTDKSSYAPGEKATLTVTIKDADGNVVPSGDYAGIFATGGIVASYTLGTGSDTTTATTMFATVDGVRTHTLYMPVTEGDVKFSWTTGSTAAAAYAGLATANQAVAGSVTVSVSSVATSAAIDAANEAAQAASDATDAALAAADAADAATTKAQEAVDAVATLSAQVSKLITALKAQITTLTNLVIKIQKKVKA
jgi:trimeric autotransporter adhesin